jgi:hypothetical protein
MTTRSPLTGTGRAACRRNRAGEKLPNPRDYLAKKNPVDLFNEFDADGSGQMELEEFMLMLPAIGIVVS